MNLKQAQYVKTIAECGSITAAAKKLFVSQPSLSQMLRQLEQETELPIFDRSTTPLRLTYAGEKYLHAAERMRRIQAARAVLRQELGTEPTAEQIARRVDIPAEKVEELLLLSPDVCSLDVPTGDGERGTLGTLLEDLEAPQPQEELVRKELAGMMDRLLDSLNPRQQTILRLHFGMEDGTCYSLEAIGEKLGISKERVRQIEKQAMDKLQSMGASMGLEDFLE